MIFNKNDILSINKGLRIISRYEDLSDTVLTEFIVKFKDESCIIYSYLKNQFYYAITYNIKTDAIASKFKNSRVEIDFLNNLLNEDKTNE
jgi:negative regulator of genetic competence, sporulation and motility